MKCLFIIFSLMSFSCFGAKVHKVGKTKLLILNEGKTFSQGETLLIRNNENKLVAKVEVLKTSTSKSLVRIIQKSKTRKLKKGFSVTSKKKRRKKKKEKKKKVAKKEEVKKQDTDYRKNLEFRFLEDGIGNMSASYTSQWRKPKLSAGLIGSLLSLGASGDINSQTGWSIGVLADYAINNYRNNNGLYVRGSAEVTSLSVEFVGTTEGVLKTYGADLLGFTMSGAVAYRYHFGRWNANLGAGLRYSSIADSVTSADDTTATGVYGGIGVKIFSSLGMSF